MVTTNIFPIKEKFEFNLSIVLCGFLYVIIFCLFIFCLFALPVCEIYLGINFGDQISCSPKTIDLSLKKQRRPQIFNNIMRVSLI
jgi:hypothetical protein